MSKATKIEETGLKQGETRIKRRYNYTKKTGKPRKYDSPEQMHTAIVQYFKDCETYEEYPTVSGLAFALGFDATQSLLDYKGYSEEYSSMLARAKLLVEQSYEDGLRARDQARGCQIALMRLGWTPKQETITHQTHEITLGEQERHLLRTMGAKLIESHEVQEVAG